MLKKLIQSSRKETNSVGKVVELINSTTAGKKLADPTLTQLVVSQESISPDVEETYQNQLSLVIDEVDNIISHVTTELGLEDNLTQAQLDAAKISAIIAADPKSYISNIQHIPTSSGNTNIITEGLESEIRHSPSLEAYDERENTKVQEYTIAFNLLASRQNEFAETLFPTITVSPDEAGLKVTINAVSVYTNIERSIDGSLDGPKFNLKKVAEAYRDHTILDFGSLKLVPEFDSTVASHATIYFDPTNTNWTENVDGVPVITAPISLGQRVSLLGISQNDALVAAGVMDTTDSLDPYMRVDEVYLDANITAGGGVPAEYFKVRVSHLVGSNFTNSLQEHHRDAILNFSTRSIIIEEATFNNLAGTAINTGGVFPTGWKVVIGLSLNGSSNLETSDTVVYGNEWKVVAVYDNNNNLVTSGATYTALVTMFENMVLAGYTLEAYRTNSNRRTRGQLVKIDRYSYIYTVSPSGLLSVIKPINDPRDDATDLASLIAIVQAKASNEAVGTLLKYSAELASNVSAASALGVEPNLHTPSVYLINPYYQQLTLDLSTTVDSITSTSREEDVRNALLNVIKNAAYNMASESNYITALDIYYGTNPPTPSIIVATDNVISRYLVEASDRQSTIGGKFNMVTVSTPDKRMSGKIFVTFGIFDANRNTTPNPLNFGYTEWVPEVTVVVPISRNGSVSKELAVDPRFRHIPLLPVLTEIDVTNLDTVVSNKQPIYNTVV